MDELKTDRPWWVDDLPNVSVRMLKSWHILETLSRCNGNRTMTAKCLGVSLRGLRNTLNDLRSRGFNIPPVEKVTTIKE